MKRGALVAALSVACVRSHGGTTDQRPDRDTDTTVSGAGDTDVALDTTGVADPADWTSGELLSRPGAHAVTVSLVPAVDVQVVVEVTDPSGHVTHTTLVSAAAAAPVSIDLTGLEEDAAYRYRVLYRRVGAAAWSPREEHGFHTRRRPGSSFVFTIQADSHLDDKSDVELYHRTLARVASEGADFHVDLGDTFMCEKHSAPLTAEVLRAASAEIVDQRYLSERAHFGLFAHSTPLLLVNGNHEGEAGTLRDGTANNVAVWATLARQRYFPGPVADDTYTTSDTGAEAFVGARQQPYAWTWGDALFVVLDPFWFTTSRARPDDRWAWTLGDAQYAWLRDTLTASDARFKFVFAHHLVGGDDPQSRGGVEAAPYFEWGGHELDGTDTFASHRPGWDEPIHDLFVKTGVTAFFHGHDHLYVRQELDGVVYQEVPQPSAPNWRNAPQLAADGGYVSGVILGSSGHLRVEVSPDAVQVDYVRAYLEADEGAGRVDGSVDDSWTVPGR